MSASLTIQPEEDFRPGRLWSLWEIMQRFRAASFTVVSGALMRALAFVEATNLDGADADIESDRKIVRDQFEGVEEHLAEMPLSLVLREQYSRVKRLIDGANSDQLLTMVREFHNNLVTEMTGHWFLLIKADRRGFYEQPHPAFGDDVATIFQDANKDIGAASRCYALDEWTACVFHLMRALEYGLKAIGKDAGLTDEQVSHENWKNIIDQIEAKIRKMEDLPKTPEKVDRLKFLSSAAAQFRYFKDAWRNHVSHAHESYDERDAGAVYTHVKTFMEQMAQASLRGGQSS